MSDATTTKRQLTIKTGVVKRLTKEELVYIKEAEEQQKRVDRFIADGKDEWDVKNQQKVLQDCLQMIPDTRKRLEAAVEDLENYLQGVDEGGDDEVAKGSEAEAARQALDAAKQQTRGLQA